MPEKAVIGAYVESMIYPCPPDNLYEKIKSAGWTSIILSMYHIDLEGDILFNRSPIVKAGSYIGASNWPELIAGLTAESSITTISASIGGWGVTDFAHIKTIYEDNNKSFAGTKLQKNFQVFRKTFPAITMMDMDCEDTYDQDSFVAFCKMLVDMDFGISFCPYTFPSFWVNALYDMEAYRQGSVKSWNAQCYIGGAPNVPKQWVKAIAAALPSFNTDGFIISGDRCRIPGRPETTDCPAEVAERLRDFAGPYLGGGFIWNIDHIIKHQNDTSSDCGKNVAMEDYVNAIAGAFVNNKIKATNGVSWM